MGWGWLFANALDGGFDSMSLPKNLETISMDLSNLWEIEHKRILCHGSRTRRHETRRESWRFILGSLRVEDISRPAKSGRISRRLFFSLPPSIFINPRPSWIHDMTGPLCRSSLRVLPPQTLVADHHLASRRAIHSTLALSLFCTMQHNCPDGIGPSLVFPSVGCHGMEDWHPCPRIRGIHFTSFSLFFLRGALFLVPATVESQ